MTKKKSIGGLCSERGYQKFLVSLSDEEKQDLEKQLKKGLCEGQILLPLRPVHEIKYLPYRQITNQGLERISYIQRFAGQQGYDLGNAILCKRVDSVKMSLYYSGSTENQFDQAAKIIQEIDGNSKDNSFSINLGNFLVHIPHLEDRIEFGHKIVNCLEKRGNKVVNLILTDLNEEPVYLKGEIYKREK